MQTIDKLQQVFVFGSQVRCEGFVSVDDCVGGDVLLAVRLPERA